MNQLYKKFRAGCRRQRFVEPGDSVLVGVSGGLDSMVLTNLFVALKKDLSFSLSLAHVNYGLRGKESDAQEALVKDFAKKHQLGCFVTHVDKRCLALFGEGAPKVPGTFSQAMAREFRYHYFAETALAMNANKVAVAHHLEDQVETILAQLLRGASLRGLGGMRAGRDIREPRAENRELRTENRNLRAESRKLRAENRKPIGLIRPLLGFSKERLRSYAQQQNIPFIEDSSNASDKYWRNRLRHELLPVIQNLRPRAFHKIIRLGEELREAAQFLEQQATQWLIQYARKNEEGYWLPRPRWEQLPKPLRLEVLRLAVQEYAPGQKNLRRDHLIRCEQLSLGTKVEGFYSLPHGIQFVRAGDDLLFKKSLLLRCNFENRMLAYNQ